MLFFSASTDPRLPPSIDDLCFAPNEIKVDQLSIEEVDILDEMLDVKEDIMEGINHPNDLLEDETDETEEPEIKNESSGFSKPTYEGGQLTLGASTLLIMSFVIRHSLSGAALADLMFDVETIKNISRNVAFINLLRFNIVLRWQIYT